MSSSDTLILYDLPSRDPCRSWSGNAWKIRMALNFKGIPYKTEWVEFPDLKPKFEGLNIPPNKEGATAYTIPTIKLPSGEYIMNSAAIAPKLEALQPSPPLHFDSPMVEKVQAAVLTLFGALIPTLGIKAAQHVPPRSAEYFHARFQRMGKSLEEMSVSDGAKNMWQIAEPMIRGLEALLDVNEGVYLDGFEPGYADFVLVAILEGVKRLDGDVFRGLCDRSPAFEELYHACEEWLRRDD